ncbi:hypothetical protein QE416_000031 [Microbacterium sp. SORGH_AS 421]|nr:hypothetical protein [Microbacterium sp. SORGH_AS_0421]
MAVGVEEPPADQALDPEVCAVGAFGVERCRGAPLLAGDPPAVGGAVRRRKGVTQGFCGALPSFESRQAQPLAPGGRNEPGTLVRSEKAHLGREPDEQVRFGCGGHGPGVDEASSLGRAQRPRSDASERGVEGLHEDVGEGCRVGEHRFGGGPGALGRRMGAARGRGIRDPRGQDLARGVDHRGEGEPVVSDEGTGSQTLADLTGRRSSLGGVEQGDGFVTTQRGKPARDRDWVEQRFSRVEHVAPRARRRDVAFGEESGEVGVAARAQRDRKCALCGGLGHVVRPCWPWPFG